uniref:FYVE-type zinc finger domain-containing protein n=1 Tax=Periophthalmus magnuspinnatus TaxID=409849 RepID=A0A3B4B559_9GOBI
MSHQKYTICSSKMSTYLQILIVIIMWQVFHDCRLLKQDLQEVCRKDAKISGWQYGERTCARCQRSLGKLWNSGAVCHGCSHRICSKCRITVTTIGWRCSVCFAYRNVKFQSGEWFLEERSKKFPTTGYFAKILNKNLSLFFIMLHIHIAVVPPTPPPHLDCAFLSKSGVCKYYLTIIINCIIYHCNAKQFV